MNMNKQKPGDYVVKLTTYDNMNDATGMGFHQSIDWFSHLSSSPDNALVFAREKAEPVAVWRSGDKAFYQALPLVDPNDAEEVGLDISGIALAVYAG